MANAGASIEAILTLDASRFNQGITKAIESLGKFKQSSIGIERLNSALIELETSLSSVGAVSKSNLNTFSRLSTAINKMANGLKILQSDTVNVEQAVNTMNSIFKAFQGTLGSVTVKLDSVAVAEEKVASTTRMSVAEQQKRIATLNANRNSVMGLITGNNQLSSSEDRVSASTSKATSSVQRQSVANRSATASTNQLSSATSRLGKAMSSLRMMGSLVGSMLAYNFAHKLLVATGETIHAKSEMEGYFKMLNFGQSDIDGFNKALDETVHQFQRVNKYSLGETISSIGVEFNLSTEEMKKAMKVTSMITSEYLRAGRNANEASLAVKDVLQGQFQRLSRETGVKGEQLKEAGWSGDTTDVLGLMEALEKVGHSRNWDVFAEKANSLNDILTISQNRFGEWSADLVNVVQPAIVSTFNSLMSFSQGVAQGLSSIWQWLNTDGWTQTAVKIGMVSSAILTLMPMLTAWRSGSNLLQVANMSLTQSLGALVFGLNAEALATTTTSEAIAMKLLGITEEQVAETGLIGAINGMIVSRTAESVATATATTTNLGFTGGLYAMITGEAIAEGTTISLTGALGLLTGAFLASPIGWFTLAILGLASAFYVLSGGLDSSWDEMKKFNETMKNAGDEQKKAQQYLADLKKEVGENSQAYKDAEESVKNWKGELQSASYWMNDATKKFEEMNLRMSAGSKPILKDLGVDDSEIAEFDATLSHLTLGKNKYYKAEQVLNAQLYNEHSNYKEDLKEYLKDVQNNGGDLQEAYEKMSGNYANLAEHSYIANTTDDWWEWMWNSLYAGMDQFWIDWDKFWANPNWEGAINGLWRGLKSANPFGGILKNLGLDDFDLGKVLNDFSSQIGKVFDGKTLMELLGLDPNTDYIGDFFNWLSESFWNSVNGFIDSLSNGGSESNGMKKIDVMSILKGLLSLGDSIDFSWASDYINNNIVIPLTTEWNNFMADPLSYLGGFIGTFGMGGLVSALMGGEVVDYAWVWEYLNNNIIIPLQTQWSMFLADPLSYIGGVVTTGLGGLLNALMPNDGGVSILNWVNTSIIQPMTLGIQNGIASIPIIGNIAQMLGLVPQQNQNAYTTGYNLIDNLKRGVEQKISEIPIIGDIARMLGLIPQQNSNAHDKGHGVGDNIKQGEADGHKGMADNIRTEMGNVISAISKKAGEAYAVAHDVGSQIINGIKDAMDMHSPSIISRELIANEFGVYIPNAIRDGGANAYNTAMEYGQQIKDGISSVNLNSFGSFATDYEADTQMINTSTELMGIDTTTAFNNMSTAVNSTTNTMGSNVISTYTSMQTKQASSLNTMKQQNLSAYNDMYLKSNQSLVHMRDSTSNVTHQMTNAWNTMKNNIVESANRLKHDSTVHFNTLSNTIGGFYRKIQNPSSWGGSPHGGSTHRNVTAGRRIASSFTGGRKYSGGRGSTYDGRNTMTIAQLKKKICPSGDCNGIFDGWSATDVVDVRTFLSMVDEGGFGSWSDWHNTHYNHIKNKSDAWSMKSPTIQLKGGIPTNADYKVGDFESGSPKISFASFQSMAESIFSAIPYRFYYNSDWKGSWLGALQAGACNCWDGAHAILAFANSCGFGGSIAHGSWVDPDGTTYPHVWAVINGKKMDTTGWQQRGSWSAGSPNARIGNATRVRTNDNNTQPSINVTVNINEPVYGVDDLDSKIADGVDKGLSKHFNKSYAIGV